MRALDFRPCAESVTPPQRSAATRREGVRGVRRGGPGEERRRRHADERVHRVPDRVEVGNLVGEELDEVEQARGHDDPRVRENRELAGQAQRARASQESQHGDRRVEAQARGERGAREQAEERDRREGRGFPATPSQLRGAAAGASSDGRRGVERSRSKASQRFSGLSAVPPCASIQRAHEILAEVVVDDVAAVLIDEAHALLGARRRHQRVLGQPRRRGLRVDLAVQVSPRGLVSRVGERLGERPDPAVAPRRATHRGRRADRAPSSRTRAAPLRGTRRRCRSSRCPPR